MEYNLWIRLGWVDERDCTTSAGVRPMDYGREPVDVVVDSAEYTSAGHGTFRQPAVILHELCSGMIIR